MAGVGNAAYDVSEEDVHVYSNTCTKDESNANTKNRQINEKKIVENLEIANRRTLVLVGVVIGLCVLIVLILVCLVVGIAVLAPQKTNSKENEGAEASRPVKTAPESYPVFPVKQCEEGWDYLGISKKCYKFYDRKLTWSEARALCIAKGAKLAEPRTLDEMKELSEFANYEAIQQHIWVGIREWKKDCPTCIRTGLTKMERRKGWVFDSDEAEATYDNWASDQPNDMGHTCLHLWRPDRKISYKMADLGCTWTFTLICEKQPNFITKNSTTLLK